MKRFNLSAWAVGHPTLILFLMIVLGAAGFFDTQPEVTDHSVRKPLERPVGVEMGVEG